MKRMVLTGFREEMIGDATHIFPVYEVVNHLPLHTHHWTKYWDRWECTCLECGEVQSVEWRLLGRIRNWLTGTRR